LVIKLAAVPRSEDDLDIDKAEEILNERDHYGLEKPKERCWVFSHYRS